jgi:glycosyltransferase involved in cell wall biosynthesis
VYQALMAGLEREITVVMPVYNALPYLDAAIASIMDQTLTQFRLAIYDDHSDDGSYERALVWAQRDPRISVARGERRLGPSDSSNAAAMLATTEFVARMDADDVAMPERLALQLEIMKAHPEAVMVGALFEMIDGTGTVIRPAMRRHLNAATPPIAHASIFYRHAAFQAAGGYRTDTDYFEDQDLYRRLGQVGALLYIDVPLVQLRFAGQHARLRDSRTQVLERISRYYQSDDLINGKTAKRLDPVAFYAVGVLAVLGLERPHLFGMMIRRASFRRPLKALAVLAFTGLAEISPRLARGLNALIARLRSGWFADPVTAPAVQVWTFDPR